MADYQRIHQVIYTVLDSADKSTAGGCIFFSIFGAYMLETIYKKKAIPVAGSAFYLLDNESGITSSFAHMDGEIITSSKQAFHCWIQCEGYVIDFMAPVFKESLQSKGYINNVPRKMFQKKLTNMSSNWDELMEEGDFYHLPNIDLTKDILQSFMSKHSNKDLLNVCLSWYTKPPKAILNTLGLMSDDGTRVNMKLNKLELVGAW